MSLLSRLTKRISAAALALFIAPQHSSAMEVERIEPEDDEIEEEWARVTNNHDLLGVGAAKLKGTNSWQVFVAVAEFVREEPLQSKLEREISQALLNTPGVVGVEREDREVWVVTGKVSGESLVRASAVALDRLEPELRAAYDALLEST